MKEQMLKYIILVVAFIYVIIPIDLIPDIAPLIGWVDDVVIAAGAIYFFLKR